MAVAVGTAVHQGLTHHVAEGNISLCTGLGNYRYASALPGNGEVVFNLSLWPGRYIQEM